MGSGRRRLVKLAVTALLLVGAWLGLACYYNLGPIEFLGHAGRVVGTPILAEHYSEDRREVERIAESYIAGDRPLHRTPPFGSWKALEARTPGLELLEICDTQKRAIRAVPFVYESKDAPHLQALSEAYDLPGLVDGMADEYEAMLRLGAWAGSQWDHGREPGVTDLVQLIELGKRGAKFHCFSAATLTVEAAAALGWPSRRVTGSQDGYSWQHGVAELWSDKHRKWFVLDTDFNVVFEVDGVPLSAWELCHRGPELQESGRLVVRPIAPPKPSLPYQDLLPFFGYVHIDMRNDWYTRKLRPGSPAGGDRATWWTARDSFPNVLTAKVRIDEPRWFDWEVNTVKIHAIGLESEGTEYVLHLALASYCPYFVGFEHAVDDAPFTPTDGASLELRLGPGTHTVRARAQTESGYPGPVTRVRFRLKAEPEPRALSAPPSAPRPGE